MPWTLDLSPFRIRSRYPITRFAVNKGGSISVSRRVASGDNAHMSSIVTTTEVILQLCTERHRKRFILLEGRLFAVTLCAIPGERFPERSECQMFCRLEDSKKIRQRKSKKI